MADSQLVERVSIAIVREYLARKVGVLGLMKLHETGSIHFPFVLISQGFKEALQVLDRDSPRTSDDISSRSELAKALHIERLMKKNKASGAPLR